MSGTWRRSTGVGAAVISTLGGLMAAPVFGPLTTLPAAIAVAGAGGTLLAGPHADHGQLHSLSSCYGGTRLHSCVERGHHEKRLVTVSSARARGE